MVIYTDGPLSFMIYCMTSSSVQKVLSVWKKNTSVFHQNFTTWTYDHKHDNDQVLVERVRQTAWEMHYAKTDSIIYLFRWPIKRLMYFHSQFIHTWSSLSISDHILTINQFYHSQFRGCRRKRQAEPQWMPSVPLPHEHQQAILLFCWNFGDEHVGSSFICRRYSDVVAPSSQHDRS